MARTSRQSKIIEIISQKEIETQEDLARELSLAGFEITQATISRDIKELGLIKILSDSKKYKYAFVESSDQTLTAKHLTILKEIAISSRAAGNIIVVKTIKSGGSMVASLIDKLNLDGILGTAYGDESVIIASDTPSSAQLISDKLTRVLEG